MTNLERAQFFVMGQCLSDWPENATYDQVCEMIENDKCGEDDEPLVVIWDPFEDLDVLEIMDNMLFATIELLEGK
jgi:hypothetical protein